MIEIRNLTKRFAQHTAVDGLSFQVQQGEVLGFLGPNGAGKSTTMKMLTGFLAPTSGSASILGFDIQTHTLKAQRQIGYLPEGAPCYGDMTVRGFLEFIAEVRGFRGAEKKQRVLRAVAQVELDKVLEQSIETLSKGFKRRVGLAQAIVHDPKVLILDEPTDGLDPNQKHEMRAIIRAMSPGKAIIISTHLLDEVEAVCSRAIIIAQGRVLADDTPAGLAARSPFHNAVRVGMPAGADPMIAAELAHLPGVRSAEPASDADGEGWLLFPRAGRVILPEISELVRARGWPVTALRAEHGRLDDVFRAITLPGEASPRGLRDAA